MAQYQNTCRFCGRPGVTKEHVWGKWSRKYRPILTGRTDHIIRIPTDPYDLDSPRIETLGKEDRNQDPRSMSLKVACEDCNGRWMKKVVDDAISTLLPLHDGDWSQIEQGDLKSLIAWLIMVTMTGEFAYPDGVTVTPEERLRFRETREAGAHWAVAIGVVDQHSWSDFQFHRSMTLEHSNGTSIPLMACLLGFGELFAFTFFSGSEFNLNFDEFATYFRLVPLHPRGNGKLERPDFVYQKDHVLRLMDEISHGIFTMNDGPKPA